MRLFEVKKQHVLSTVINHETGEVKQRRRLKWVKTEITSLVTKTKRWLLKKTVEASQEVLHAVQTRAAAGFNLAAHELSSEGACQSEIDWLLGKVGSATCSTNQGPPQQELELACECG
ncbi:hypothetical protein [Limnobacter sp.]|uniref:hypothetical protein n=1 Tax=Limnobacter sp. TaxID=2003368 RepID=UPI003BA9C2DB